MTLNNNCTKCSTELASPDNILAHIRNRLLGATSLDYSTTAEQAFRFGPPSLRFLAPIARYAVNIMLMFTQLGFCCVYFLFVSSSLYEVRNRLFKAKCLIIGYKNDITLDVLPLQNAMKTPEDFGGLSGVLTTGMVIVICLYTAVGFYGYLKYGNYVKASITFNLPSVPLSELIRLTFAVAVFLTYALQFYVPLSIIWSYLKEKFQMEGRCSSRVQTISELLLRTFLVFITCKYGYTDFGTYKGNETCPLFWKAFIKINFVLLQHQRKMTLIIIKDVAIILFGIFGCIIGTYTTIKEIVHQIGEPS
ncbi:proton-coupled amino acid transporter-like protein CG1139 [Parasteatoda tepidariorum]|uniref:proton-coupled amino acid transporter-like protein CG1139 n=1 Tax=Parasteatoda tepidariorum TaxID=114398 RepID=UPI0039BC8F51